MSDVQYEKKNREKETVNPPEVIRNSSVEEGLQLAKRNQFLKENDNANEVVETISRSSTPRLDIDSSSDIDLAVRKSSKRIFSDEEECDAEKKNHPTKKVKFLKRKSKKNYQEIVYPGSDSDLDTDPVIEKSVRNKSPRAQIKSLKRKLCRKDSVEEKENSPKKVKNPKNKSDYKNLISQRLSKSIAEDHILQEKLANKKSIIDDNFTSVSNKYNIFNICLILTINIIISC